MQMLKHRSVNSSQILQTSLQNIDFEHKNILKSCRLCLRPRQDLSIFKDVEDAVNFSEIAMALANIEIGINDGYPQSICNNCASKLTFFYEFKKKCELSYTTLVAIIPKQYFMEEEVNQLLDIDSTLDVNDGVLSSDDITIPKINSLDTDISNDDHNNITDQDISENLTKSHVPLINEQNLKDYLTQCKSKKFECYLCKRYFNKFCDLKLHQKFHINQALENIQYNKNVDDAINMKIYKCEQCGRGFRKSSNLKRHYIIHTNLWTFSCEICLKKFRRRADVIVHKQKHHADKSTPKFYKCRRCKVCFDNIADLRIHRIEHPIIATFECDSCDKVFNKRSNLNRHKISHSEARNFKCEICYKKFKSKADLNIHDKRHKGIPVSHLPTYQCEECGKIYRRKISLNQHIMEFHRGIKDYKYECDICKKKMTEKKKLTEHMVFHSNIKPYKCDFCGKDFHKLMYMVRHRIIHLDVWNYECELCGRRFKRTTDLTRHSKTHRTDQLLKCEHCDRVYFSKSGYRKHAKTHSAIENSTTANNIEPSQKEENQICSEKLIYESKNQYISAIKVEGLEPEEHFYENYVEEEEYLIDEE